LPAAIGRFAPTRHLNNGTIEAVDTKQQKQLWLYDYVDERTAILFDDSHDTDDRWIEPRATVVNDLVIVTASDCDWIFCIELQSGNLKWKLGRRAALYFAAVNQDQVLLISPHDITSVRISDGQPAWNEPLSLGETLPSGRGFSCEQFYFLPTTNGVLKIDSSSGKIVDQAAVKSPLGNIIWHQGEFISHSLVEVSAFPTR